MDKRNAEETACLRSVVAALAWIARQVRPDFSYRVSRVQTVAGHGRVKDVRECNKVLVYVLQTSQQCVYFVSAGFSWGDAVVCTITDVSFRNESAYAAGVKEDGRRQQGYVICLAPGDIANRTDAMIHPTAWSSTVIKRVCRSTFMAETFSMIRGAEAGALLRAAI